MAILGDGRVEAVEVVAQRARAGRRRAASGRLPTDERETIPCGIVFRSVGYHGVAAARRARSTSARGTIPNEGGRVLDDDGEPFPALYCAGWIKRGPSGVIGTNKKDATETVELLLEDARAGLLLPGGRRGGRRSRRSSRERGVEAVLYAGWEAIDAAERAAGEPLGRPRVKLCTLGRAARRGAGRARQVRVTRVRRRQRALTPRRGRRAARRALHVGLHVAEIWRYPVKSSRPESVGRSGAPDGRHHR